MPQPNFKNLIGKTFHRLTVIERAKNGKKWRTRWVCKCTCGSIITVAACHLKNGHTQSCGCFKIDTLIKVKTTHGMAYTPEYGIWLSIIQRCTNSNSPDFKYYGGRGITICDEWKNDFKAFFDHVGKRPSPKHSIDRIRNNGNYEINNVKWSLPLIQANNKRNNYNITLHNQTMTMAQWAKFVGMRTGTLWKRIHSTDWSIEKAIFLPVRQHKQYKSYPKRI